MTSPSTQPLLIAYRKACNPSGTGLSHYVLLTNEAPLEDAPDSTN